MTDKSALDLARMAEAYFDADDDEFVGNFTRDLQAYAQAAAERAREECIDALKAMRDTLDTSDRFEKIADTTLASAITGLATAAQDVYGDAAIRARGEG